MQENREEGVNAKASRMCLNFMFRVFSFSGHSLYLSMVAKNGQRIVGICVQGIEKGLFFFFFFFPLSGFLNLCH
jgi:hypothetical protein